MTAAVAVAATPETIIERQNVVKFYFLDKSNSICEQRGGVCVWSATRTVPTHRSIVLSRRAVGVDLCIMLCRTVLVDARYGHGRNMCATTGFCAHVCVIARARWSNSEAGRAHKCEYGCLLFAFGLSRGGQPPRRTTRRPYQVTFIYEIFRLRTGVCGCASATTTTIVS